MLGGTCVRDGIVTLVAIVEGAAAPGMNQDPQLHEWLTAMAMALLVSRIIWRGDKFRVAAFPTSLVPFSRIRAKFGTQRPPLTSILQISQVR